MSFPAILVRTRPVEYQRGSLRGRLACGAIERVGDAADALVLDPDSRLTQSPAPDCPDNVTTYSKAARMARIGAGPSGTVADSNAGNATKANLSRAGRLLGTRNLASEGGRSYLSLATPAPTQPGITVSLGVGENPASVCRIHSKRSC